MEEAAESAKRVREDLQSFRNRSVVIDGQEPCSICEVYLLVKPFFLFPCGHKFHTDCLESGVWEYLSKPPGASEITKFVYSNLLISALSERARLRELKTQLQTINVNAALGQQNESASTLTRDQIKTEIETILANDCLYCGEHMINSIDKPFIDDWERVNLDWE